MKKLQWIVAGGLFASLLSAALLASGLPQEQDCRDSRVPIVEQADFQDGDLDPKYGRGRVESKEAKLRHEGAYSRHNGRIERLPKVTSQSWDCRTMGLVPPVVSQGSCGSCWDFAGCGIITSALIKAGYGKADGAFGVSEQYVLDCVPSGKCNGDDYSTVFSRAKATGLPTVADYGPYRGGPQRCNFTNSMKLYRIADWGYCTPAQNYGIAGVQDIKNCIVAYGPVGSAVAADSSWDRYTGGIYKPSGSRQVNHEVILIGWQDDASLASGGYWIMRNSWGNGWGEGGYMKIPYGANQIGTEAAWCSAVPLPPPPVPPIPPTPPPPGPGIPTINLPNGLPPGNYQIVPVPGPAPTSAGETV